MRDYTTSSEMSRLGHCAASATLMRSDEANLPADIGNAKHDHIDQRSKLGVDEAMRLIPQTAKRWELSERETFFFGVWARKFEWSPPPGSFGEVSLAWLTDGTVERTVGGKGQYPDLDPGGRLHGRAIHAGQNDLLWSSPEPLDLTDPAHPRCPKGSMLWIGDAKSGKDVYVSPIATNLQVAANAVMAARWTGARHVVPFILFLDPPHGTWDVPEGDDGQQRPWGPADLADAESRVRAVLDRRRALMARALAGELIDGWYEGEWCNFCPGRLSCPAKVAMMRHTAALAVTKAPLDLTDDEAVWWAIRLTQIESFTSRAREHLKRHVDAKGPISLGGGLVWGSQQKAKSHIVPHIALPIIQAELGAEAEKLDAIAKISREGIADVIRADHEARGLKRQLSKAVGRVMVRIKEAGGIESESSTQYGTYRPAEQLATGGEDDEDNAEAAAQ